MPFFGRQGILAKTADAGGAALDAGFFQNEFFHTNANKAAHPVIDRGSGNDWNDANSGTFSFMLWFKGTTSEIDSTYANALIFRTLSTSSGDNGQFAEITSAGIVTGTQQNNGTFRLIIWQPASFSADYLDGEWHHIAAELKPGSSKIFADGVDKSSEATLPGGSAATPNGDTRYLFFGALPLAASSASYGGVRASKMKWADFWYKNGDNGALDFATNKDYVYSPTGDPWNDLGATGTAGGNIPTPHIFLRIDAGDLVQDGSSGTYSLATGTGSSNQFEESTGGPLG